LNAIVDSFDKLSSSQSPHEAYAADIEESLAEHGYVAAFVSADGPS
jgi:hypothetical protein